MKNTAMLPRLKASYLPLIKSPQTLLLLSTGLAGYTSARCPVTHWSTLVGLLGSLFLAISGSTALNMWYDRDIDARMQRTSRRPLVSGLVSPPQALALGLGLSTAGVGSALALDALFGAIVFAGLFFDVAVYTILLKRRTAWSIVWGGISGGMPVLAGRALGLGAIDWIGLLLALGVLLWIPTHILTFSIRHQADYARAGVPTFPSTYGVPATRLVISVSSLLAGVAMVVASLGIGIEGGPLQLLGLLSAGLLALAIGSLLHHSEKTNFVLFKYASLYMLLSMALIVLTALQSRFYCSILFIPSIL